MFPVPDTCLSCKWQPSNLELFRFGSVRSNSEYKAISASQQSWNLGLADLGKNKVSMLKEQKCSPKIADIQRENFVHINFSCHIYSLFCQNVNVRKFSYIRIKRMNQNKLELSSAKLSSLS